MNITKYIIVSLFLSLITLHSIFFTNQLFHHGRANNYRIITAGRLVLFCIILKRDKYLFNAQQLPAKIAGSISFARQIAFRDESIQKTDRVLFVLPRRIDRRSKSRGGLDQRCQAQITENCDIDRRISEVVTGRPPETSKAQILPPADLRAGGIWIMPPIIAPEASRWIPPLVSDGEGHHLVADQLLFGRAGGFCLPLAPTSCGRQFSSLINSWGVTVEFAAAKAIKKRW